MNHEFASTSIATVVRQRNIAVLSILGLTVVNIILICALLGKEERWVLMPQHDVEHKLEVQGSRYSDQYLIDWASGVLNSILCANADSIDWKIHQILKISRKNYGELKAQLNKEAEKIKRDQVSTVFYPSTFKIYRKGQAILISGDYSAWFGKDKAPVTVPKTYRLTWAIRSHGVLLLDSLEEITKEQTRDKNKHDKN